MTLSASFTFKAMLAIGVCTLALMSQGAARGQTAPAPAPAPAPSGIQHYVPPTPEEEAASNARTRILVQKAEAAGALAGDPNGSPYSRDAYSRAYNEVLGRAVGDTGPIPDRPTYADGLKYDPTQVRSVNGPAEVVPYAVANYFKTNSVITSGELTSWGRTDNTPRPAEDGSVSGGGFGPNLSKVSSIIFNDTMLANAPPGVQQWYEANKPQTGMPYGTSAWGAFYSYMSKSAQVTALKPFLDQWGDINTLTVDQIQDRLSADPATRAGVLAYTRQMGDDIGTAAGEAAMVKYMKDAVYAAQYQYDRSAAAVSDYQLQQKALQRDGYDSYEGYEGEWLVDGEPTYNRSAGQATDLDAMRALLVQLDAQAVAARKAFEQQAQLSDPSLAFSSPTTVATLDPIYRNYVVTPGQGGSTVALVTSTQVLVPTDVMTVPTTQILVPSTQVITPSLVMTSLDLEPVLCGR